MKTEYEQNFIIISSVLLTVLGTIFNTFVVIIYLSKRLRRQSMSRYIVGLAISDQIELISSIIINNANNFKFTSIDCKITAFISTAFFEYCSFIIMIISIDRWVCVRFPKRFVTKDSFKFQFIVLITAFILTIPIAGSAAAYYEKIDSDNSTLFCDFSDKEIGSYISSFGFIISIVIPLTEMITCSILIWIRLKKSKVKVRNLKNEMRKENKLFRITMFIHLYFIICNIPVCCYLVTITFFPELTNPFVFIVLNTFSLFHNSFSFFIYILSNKVFRTQFRELMRKSNSVHESKTLAINASNRLKTTQAFN